MNKDAIQDLYSNYHRKVKSNANLYTQPNYVQVVLPRALQEYCNAGAGRNPKYGPIGIRRICDDPKTEIARIFSSLGNLERFVATSERNAIQDVEVNGRKLKMRVSKPRRPHAVSLRKYFWENHTKEDLEALKAKFGYDELRKAFDEKMPLADLKAKFGL
jgi:hypothetical protein